MPLRRTRPASCAGALTLLTALLLAGGSARGAAAPTQLTDVQQASVQLVKGFLDPRLSTPAVEAVISSARDGKMGMAYMLEQLDRCWTRVTHMPREPLAEAEKETFYCAAYAYVALTVDRHGTVVNGTPPTPGLDPPTIDGKVQDALIRIGYPAAVAPAFADVIHYFTLVEGTLFVSRGSEALPSQGQGR